MPRFPAVLSCAGMLALATSAGAQVLSTDQRAYFAETAEYLARGFLVESHAPSVNIAIVRGRDTLLIAGYGVTDFRTKRPTTVNTVYEIGSVTKQFTAAAIMRLVEQRKLSLDDDVAPYVPRFPLRGRHVTIRQLLNHTSGIHSYTTVPTWRTHWAEELAPDSVIGFVARDTFDFAPGTSYRYNNTGYIMLGMVIERVAKVPYATYLQNEFFKPLALTHTSYCPSHRTDPDFATGYSKNVVGAGPSDYLSMTQPFSAGALCSTATDLVKWQRALADGRVVSPGSYQQMATPAKLANGQPLTYGFGLQPGTYIGHAYVTHDGGIPGFLSAVWYFAGDQLSVVVLTNYDSAPPETLAKNLIRLSYGMDTGGSLKNPPPE